MIVFDKILMSYVCKGLNGKKINIGAGYGLVPEGTKPLPDPIMTHFIDTYIWLQCVNPLWAVFWKPQIWNYIYYMILWHRYYMTYLVEIHPQRTPENASHVDSVLNPLPADCYKQLYIWISI